MEQKRPTVKISERDAKGEREAVRKALDETEAPTKTEIANDDKPSAPDQRVPPRT